MLAFLWWDKSSTIRRPHNANTSKSSSQSASQSLVLQRRDIGVPEAPFYLLCMFTRPVGSRTSVAGTWLLWLLAGTAQPRHCRSGAGMPCGGASGSRNRRVVFSVSLPKRVMVQRCHILTPANRVRVGSASHSGCCGEARCDSRGCVGPWLLRSCLSRRSYHAGQDQTVWARSAWVSGTNTAPSD